LLKHDGSRRVCVEVGDDFHVKHGLVFWSSLRKFVKTRHPFTVFSLKPVVFLYLYHVANAFGPVFTVVMAMLLPVWAPLRRPLGGYREIWQIGGKR